MDTGQKKFVLLLSALAVACWLLSPLAAGPVSQPRMAVPRSPRFDGGRTYAAALEYAARYPRRPLGSIAARQSTAFFREYLAPLGYRVEYAHFDATVAGHRQVGRNVLAFKKGELEETIAVVAHYDTAVHAAEASPGEGLGVAVLLELARVFSEEPTRRSILFVAVDGEKAGILGALDLARSFGRRSALAAAVSLGGAAAGGLSGIALACVGLDRGYAPAWLRLAARAAAEAEGLDVAELSGFEEHLERSYQLPATGAGAFLGAGIPAIGLEGITAGAPHAHSGLDFSRPAGEGLEPEGIGKFGRAAERLVAALAGAPSLPLESPGAFRIRKGRYLPAPLGVLLHLISFAPFAAAFLFHWRRYNEDFGVELFARETVSFLGTWIPFLVVYAGIAFCWSLRLLPRYSLYPPPAGDPVMESPDWRITAYVFLAGAAAVVLLYFLGRYLTRKVPRAPFYPVKLFLLLVLVLVVALSLAANSYWAVTFLWLPSLVWSLTGCAAAPGARAANRVLVLAAGIPALAALVATARAAGLGWNAVWFHLLALSTGLFRFSTYALATAAAALGIRFFFIQSRPPR